MQKQVLRRNDRRLIIHFDYDCFYAAVFEREDPNLKFLPLAVQQKQIIVTCNYEARRRGLYKLQLVKEARKKCPDVIIVLGEDLTRFRNASKENYNFLRQHIWSKKVERLGFDEVFMDVTDMVDYNLELLNRNALNFSFFHLDRDDPTVGFSFDASRISGHVFPSGTSSSKMILNPEILPSPSDPDDLSLRLLLGSHLAQYLRHQLEEQKGYSSTVGISTNKLLSKLVGNVNKPKGQTTLAPPYNSSNERSESNVIKFIDDHDIGKIPGIGFKTAQKIRKHVLERPAKFSAGLVYGGTKENVKARDVRILEGMGFELLGHLLTGPGTPRDLGEKVWGLINGVDDSEVAKAKEVPQQISIEDSYIRLNELEAVKKEMRILAGSLIKRLHLDLTTSLEDDEIAMISEEDDGNATQDTSPFSSRKWIALPLTLRLTTRPRPPPNADGSRSRNFTRISKSGSMPSFVFNLALARDVLVGKLVEEALMPLFRKLHPEKSGWDLSLVNVCATNMSFTGSDGKDGAGRDIGRMFRNQEGLLKQWKVDDVDNEPSYREGGEQDRGEIPQRRNRDIPQYRSSVDSPAATDTSRSPAQERFNGNNDWDSEEDGCDEGEFCGICGAAVPTFAMNAHERFHAMPD